MNVIHAARRRPVSIVVVLFTALLGALLVALTAGQPADATPGRGHAGGHGGGHGHGQVAELRTPAQVAFHDDMRKLWEDHVTWTRLAIVSFSDDSAGFDAAAARLLRNQVDIGDAIKPYFGDAAGDRLTSLLNGHITIAVELLQAARSGDSVALDDAGARWYANSDQIADLLADANPRYWPAADLRASMRTHLDQTLAEASQELGGDYAASVVTYDEIHVHILDMADLLSSGIMQRFPDRFGR